MARMYKASAFVDSGDYVKGSQLLRESAGIFTRQRDTANLVSSRNTLAVVYSKIGFYDEAEKERNEVIKLSRLQRNYASLVPALFNAAIDADKNNNQELRIAYLEEAERNSEINNVNVIYKPYIKYSLLSAYSDNKNLAKANAYYREIQNDFAKRNPIPAEFAYKSALADYYTATGDFEKALINAIASLEYHQQSNNAEGTSQAYGRLVDIYKGLNDYENAFSYTMKYNRI